MGFSIDFELYVGIVIPNKWVFLKDRDEVIHKHFLQHPDVEKWIEDHKEEKDMDEAGYKDDLSDFVWQVREKSNGDPWCLAKKVPLEASEKFSYEDGEQIERESEHMLKYFHDDEEGQDGIVLAFPKRILSCERRGYNQMFEQCEIEYENAEDFAEKITDTVAEINIEKKKKSLCEFLEMWNPNLTREEIMAVLNGKPDLISTSRGG